MFGILAVIFFHLFSENTNTSQIKFTWRFSESLPICSSHLLLLSSQQQNKNKKLVFYNAYVNTFCTAGV